MWVGQIVCPQPKLSVGHKHNNGFEHNGNTAKYEEHRHLLSRLNYAASQLDPEVSLEGFLYLDESLARSSAAFEVGAGNGTLRLLPSNFGWVWVKTLAVGTALR